MWKNILDLRACQSKKYGVKISFSIEKVIIIHALMITLTWPKFPTFYSQALLESNILLVVLTLVSFPQVEDHFPKSFGISGSTWLNVSHERRTNITSCFHRINISSVNTSLEWRTLTIFIVIWFQAKDNFFLLVTTAISSFGDIVQFIDPYEMNSMCEEE